ncbi:MAG TPA: DUF4333 domain-containing protein [Actinomycetota bacterium]|nr:DUF4333 domain-containing protein [Actinomycetota bacterium]
MPSTRTRRIRLACAVAALIAVAAVCNPPLDTEGLEPQLLEQAEEQTGQDYRSVSCPRDVQPEAGKEFECTAVDSDGINFTILVTQIDDKGKVDWRFVDAAAPDEA